MNTPYMTAPALEGAIGWVSATLLGSSATAIAVIAVACLSFLLLSGRLPVRHGISALFGCFILFAAGALADALTGGFNTTDVGPAPLPVPQVQYSPTTPRATPYDPYAGASVPTRPAEPPPIR